MLMNNDSLLKFHCIKEVIFNLHLLALQMQYQKLVLCISTGSPETLKQQKRPGYKCLWIFQCNTLTCFFSLKVYLEYPT